MQKPVPPDDPNNDTFAVLRLIADAGVIELPPLLVNVASKLADMGLVVCDTHGRWRSTRAGNELADAAARRSTN